MILTLLRLLTRKKRGLTASSPKKSYYKKGSGKTGRKNKRSFLRQFFNAVIIALPFLIAIIQKGN